LVFIILAVTSVHSNKIKKKAKNDVSNENNDDDEFFNELKSEESDRDLNEVQENLLSRRPRHGLRRSKRWVFWPSHGCYWGGYSYCGCYNYYYYYCTSWYVWRKQNGKDVEIPVRPPAGEDFKTPPKAPSRRRRWFRSFSQGHMTPMSYGKLKGLRNHRTGEDSTLELKIEPLKTGYAKKNPEKTEDSTYDLKIKKLAEKAEQDIPVKELVLKVKELVEEADKDPVKMKMLKYFVQNGLRGIDSDIDLKIQELAEKDEKGIPAESEAKELMWEVMKNPKVVDAQKKKIKKRFIVPALIGWEIVFRPFRLTFPANPEKLKGLRHFYATFFDRTGTPVESEAKELVEEAEKDPERIKKLKGLRNLKTGEDSTFDLKLRELAEKSLEYM